MISYGVNKRGKVKQIGGGIGLDCTCCIKFIGFFFFNFLVGSIGTVVVCVVFEGDTGDRWWYLLPLLLRRPSC